MAEDLKPLLLTRKHAELLLDKIPVSNPETRDLALRLMSLVLSFAAEAAVNEARKIAGIADTPIPQ